MKDPFGVYEVNKGLPSALRKPIKRMDDNWFPHPPRQDRKFLKNRYMIERQIAHKSGRKNSQDGLTQGWRKGMRNTSRGRLKALDENKRLRPYESPKKKLP